MESALTTDTLIDFMRAYEIYSVRWVIEVFFADSKCLLGLVDCSARIFIVQLAHVSLVMMCYNLLASLKRSLDYETIEGPFRDVYAGVYELTVVEVVAMVAEATRANEDYLMRQLIENSKRLEALQVYAENA